MSPNLDQYVELMFSETEDTHGLQQNLSDGDTCHSDTAMRYSCSEKRVVSIKLESKLRV